MSSERKAMGASKDSPASTPGTRASTVLAVLVVMGLLLIPSPAEGSPRSEWNDVEVASPSTRGMTLAGPTNFQSNICGAYGCGGQFNGAASAVFKLRDTILASPLLAPYTIGIQEACRSQANRLLSDLNGMDTPVRPADYRMVFYTYIPQDPSSDICKNSPIGVRRDYGIAILVASSSSLSQIDFASFSNEPGDHDRGAVCGRGKVLDGYTYWGCTAHLNPNGWGPVQVAPYYQWMVEPRLSERIFWGGDLYASFQTIDDYMAGFNYRDHYEGDLCADGSWRWTHAGNNLFSSSDNKKFDYSFRSGVGAGRCTADMLLNPQSELEMYGGPFAPAGAYDHRILGGHQGFVGAV